MASDAKTRIAAMGDEIEKLPPEFRLLARYIEAYSEYQMEQVADMKRAFTLAQGAVSVLKYLAIVGAPLAALWGFFHGKNS